MDKLLSEGALKSRKAAEEANNKGWLNSEIDIGVIVADSEEDAQRQKEWHVQNQKRFLDSTQANTAARHLNAQTYYVTAFYGKPETLHVGDKCADYSPLPKATVTATPAPLAQTA